LDKAKSWVDELQRQADPDIVIALAGNKTDLEARRAIDTKASDGYDEKSNHSYVTFFFFRNRRLKSMLMKLAYSFLKPLPKQPTMSPNSSQPLVKRMKENRGP
jgi:Ras-related protein Rab-5C